MIEKEARLKVINLSRLEEIKDLRTVWPHEALDFTPWLSQDDNISLLADAVEMDITVDETESSVGDFNVDIFASETGTDRKIIIENQLEDTNHDHLGKLITYASGKSADVVIWVVKHAREEHKAAIEWLNNHTDDNVGFFLCEIKLYRIGSSEPAVKFEVVERPNDWTKEVRKSESVNETQQSRYDYWVAFEDYVFNIPAFAKNFKRTFNMTMIVMLNNTIEYDEVRFHERHDSIISAVRSFATKLASAVDQTVVALILIISNIYAISQKNIIDERKYEELVVEIKSTNKK